MSSASHGVWGVRRPAIRWAGLTALVLLAACAGERRESPDAGTEVAAVTDSAPTAVTGASPAGTNRDTAAKGPAQPAKSTTTPKPATPKPATPEPTTPAQAAPAQDTTSAAASTQDTAATTQDTATGQDPVTPAQDTAAAAQGEAAGESQTASAQLRDQYHQAPKDTVEQATYDGWKQYNLNCARCHGEDVMGTTIAPHLTVSLKPDGPVNTQEAFVEVVCAGRPEKGMPSWCALGMDPAKINQIYSYVKGRSEGKIGVGRPAVKQEG